MRKKAGCHVRCVKHADALVEQARIKLNYRSIMKVFIRAFAGARAAARNAYERFLRCGTLITEVRECVYKALHNLLPEQQRAR